MKKDVGMTPCQKLLKQEGTARRIESMQQSSATPSLHPVFGGLWKIVACSQSSSQCLLVSIVTLYMYFQAVRRLGGGKTASASERWKKKNKTQQQRNDGNSEAERSQVSHYTECSVYQARVSVLRVCVVQEERSKEALERLTGFADQLVSIGDYCIHQTKVFTWALGDWS